MNMRKVLFQNNSKCQEKVQYDRSPGYGHIRIGNIEETQASPERRKRKSRNSKEARSED